MQINTLLMLLNDLYRVDNVIEPHPNALIQGNSKQIIGIHYTLHTNRDIVINTAFKELNSLK